MAHVQDQRGGLQESARQEARFDGIPARIVLTPLAPPSILGLFGFMAATAIVGAHLAGWFGDADSPSYFFPFLALVGGVAQFAAGLFAFRARDGLATAFHGIWGGFFMAYGVLYALVAAGTITLPPAGAEFPAFAMWFVVLAGFTWSAALASLGQSLGLFGVLATLAAASTILAVADFAGAEDWVTVAGWVFVVSAGLAWYTATAMLLESTFGRVVLPLGKYSKAANVPGGHVTRPVGYAHGEPGVRQGQ